MKTVCEGSDHLISCHINGLLTILLFRDYLHQSDNCCGFNETAHCIVHSENQGAIYSTEKKTFALSLLIVIDVENVVYADGILPLKSI